ncbi:MAG: sporulation integral membrane protein YtvI [Clostridiaceae bacterium]|nr:sporulation integral membrane protein YtvI [Clostridiaceae bacterium]
MLHENKHINFFLKLGYIILVTSIICSFARYGFRWGWPLLTALLFSWMISAPVNFISDKTPIPRGIVAAFFTLLILCLAGIFLYFAASFLIYRSGKLLNSIPSLIESFRADIAVFEDLIARFIREFFPMLKDMPFISLEDLLSSAMPQIDFVRLFATVSSAAGFIPGLLFTIVFIFMGTYFFTVQRNEIKALAARVVSPAAFEAIYKLKHFLYTSVFKWIKAQLILMCITWLMLSIAFFILGQDNAILVAAAVSVVDALPILGVGTVILPWVILCLLTGSFKMAAGLLITYVIVLLVRNSLEPKIVGEKIGLNPLVTLLSMYGGFRLGGFFGMVFLPIAVLSILKLQDLGYIKLWN